MHFSSEDMSENLYNLLRITNLLSSIAKEEQINLLMSEIQYNINSYDISLSDDELVLIESISQQHPQIMTESFKQFISENIARAEVKEKRRQEVIAKVQEELAKETSSKKTQGSSKKKKGSSKKKKGSKK